MDLGGQVAHGFTQGFPGILRNQPGPPTGEGLALSWSLKRVFQEEY